MKDHPPGKPIPQVIDVADVEKRMISLRGQSVLLDRDVASLYGVETKHVNQAVRNNPDKFPDGFLFQLDAVEFANWRSQIVTSISSEEEQASLKMGLRRPPYAFTERGLYMLATVLKSRLATMATLAIVNAYAQMRSMVRDMKALQTLKDASPEQARQLIQTGHKLAALIGDNLSTESTKMTIKQDLAVVGMVEKFAELREDPDFARFDDKTFPELAEAKSVIDKVEDESFTNKASMVLLFKPDHRRFLLCGDVSSSSLNSAIQRYGNELSCCILKVPHHGSKHNLTTAIIDSLKPVSAVISAKGSQKHPNSAIVTSLSRYCNVYSTHKSGWLVYRSEPPVKPAIPLKSKIPDNY